MHVYKNVVFCNEKNNSRCKTDILETRYSYISDDDDDDDHDHDNGDDDECVNVGLTRDVIIRSLFSSAAARFIASR